MPMPTFLRPFTHIDYTDEYLDLTLNKYGIIRPNYFCTYFKFDYENSILDDRKHIDSGSYHLADDLSGRKWKKIQLLPLWLVETHGPINAAMKEEGVTKEVRISYVIPDYMGVRPTPKDFVYIFNGVSNKYDEEKPLFSVINRSESHMGKRKFYKIDCRNDWHKLSEVDTSDNISSQWIYVNFFRKIFKLEIGKRLLEAMSFSYDFFNGLPEGKYINFDTSIDSYNARHTLLEQE